MTTPEPGQNPPPNPISPEYLVGRIDGFNGRIKNLESRVSSLEANDRDRHAGQGQILFALAIVIGVIIFALGGGMVAGIFALLSVLGGAG